MATAVVTVVEEAAVTLAVLKGMKATLRSAPAGATRTKAEEVASWVVTELAVAEVARVGSAARQSR